MRRRAAVIRLVAVLVCVLAAATYFLRINPIYNAIPKGLDLQGGLEMIFKAQGTADQPLNAASLAQTVQVLSYRVDKLGVASPIVTAEPPDRILVELAGVKDPQQAKTFLTTPADLQFKDAQGNIIVTGSDLKSASAQVEAGQGNVVALTFDSKGQKAFANFTAKNQGKTMSIYLNNQLIESPTIQPGCCPTGNSILTGNYTFPQAQNLATLLNSGALPLQLTVLSDQTVSATLGATSVRKSLLAGAVAMALIVAFMFLIYRVPGFWADLALLVYALLLFAVLAGLRASLTLPGITGLILSIGMAVDSNVIIYERIREELRAARSLRTAVDEGFKHGLRAIVDSNATTVIAAVVLYYLGSGLVRGFAVTVGLGVVISLLTAVVFTRYLLQWLVDAGSRPSWWFFAPRAAGQPGSGLWDVHAPAVAGAPAGTGRAAGVRGTMLGNLRRDWMPEGPGRAAPRPVGAPAAPPAGPQAFPTAENATARPAAGSPQVAVVGARNGAGGARGASLSAGSADAAPAAEPEDGGEPATRDASPKGARGGGTARRQGGRTARGRRGRRGGR